MSNKDLARRAAVELAFDGADITKSIRPYLLSMSYTDNEEDETDDLQIRLQDRDGLWLEKWLGDAIDAAASSGSGSGDDEGGATEYKVTPAIGLNVRSGPGTSYKKLGALVCGTTIQVSEIANGWAVIQYSGQTAYVCADYIQAAGGGGSGGGGGSFAVGDVVQFVGSRHYVSSTGDQGYTAKPGPAKITLSNPGSKHPWHVVHTDGTSNVYGWVNESDIQGEGSGEDSGGASTGFQVSGVIVRKNWAGDGKDQVLDCGQFELDDVSASGPPSVVTLKATSLPFNAQVRQTLKFRAWESYKLSGIAKEIAAAGGMACLYESASDPAYDRVEQFKQSDIAFLSSLCHDAGISLKATNNILVLFDQAAYESKDAVLTLKRGGGAYTKWKLHAGTADAKYTSCRVRYTDPASGKVIEATAYAEDYKEGGKNNQQLEVTAKVSSIGQAQALAEKRLRLHNKYAKTATFTLPGDPAVVAGVTVMLEGWGAWNGKYIVKQAKHTVDGSGGYETQVQLRRVLEGY